VNNKQVSDAAPSSGGPLMMFRTRFTRARFTRAVACGALVALPLSMAVVVSPAAADPDAATHPQTFRMMTPATTVAARTDRRPMAGGIYDPVARKTFISWAGKNEDNYVQEYDHRRGTWSAPVFAGDGDADSHNYPTMVQADNGRLLIFRGMHNTELVVAEAPRPHSSAGTWTDRVITEGIAASYPMPFKAANGDIYVFYRRTDDTIDPSAPVDQRPMLYVRSRDNGRTWSNSTQLTGAPFAVGSVGRQDNMDEIYFGQMRYEPGSWFRRERVHIVWTLAGGGTEGERHDRYHRNIHYAYFTPHNRHFYSAEGKDLGVQIDNADLEGATKVVETPLELPANIKTPDYIQLVGWQRSGKPFVIWFQADATGRFHNYTGHWNGRRWEVAEVATGLRTREMEEISPGTWRVYSTVDLQPDVQTAVLTAQRRWIPGPTIRTPKPVQRIELITGFRDPARLLLTGASSAREVSVADGDIHVVGVGR
jgi:hypothetical protein